MSTAANVFESTTTAIVEAIEAGAGDWHMPWLAEGIAFPWNPTTGRNYRCGNVLSLWAQAIGHGYPTGEWATYKALKSIGAQVRKGEHGTGCILWKVTDTSDDQAETTDEEARGRRRFIARIHRVQRRPGPWLYPLGHRAGHP